MKTFINLLRFSLLALTLLYCRKKDAEPGLPPATQVGANTFGCRFNGKAWIPEADKPADYNRYFTYYYDPDYAGGQLNIQASNFKTGQGLGIDIFGLSQTGTYDLSNKLTSRIRTGDNTCYYRSTPSHQDSLTYCQGKLTITKIDLNKGVISGIFFFTIAKSGCDTLRVTDGRFDLKTN